ncbi:hypothetical protein MBANPS3_012331 [Mucor bainieri]
MSMCTAIITASISSASCFTNVEIIKSDDPRLAEVTPNTACCLCYELFDNVENFRLHVVSDHAELDEEEQIDSASSLPTLDPPRVLKGISNQHNIGKKHISLSLSNAVDDSFDIKDSEHKQMPVKFQNELEDDLTAFLPRKALKKHLGEDPSLETTWKIARLGDNPSQVTKCSHVVSLQASTIGSNYIHQQYQSVLSHDSFAKAKSDAISILNTCWRNLPHMAQVQGTLLSGAILVDGEQALLLNCVEAYGRLASIDAYHEHHSGSPENHSLPLPNTLYNNIVCKLLDDKLVIGTKASSILATSNLRLDLYPPVPEVGPYTTNFFPSEATSIILSKASVKKVNEIIESENFLINSDSDILTNLKQIQSTFYCSSTYSPSKFHYIFTNSIGLQPYSLVALAVLYEKPLNIAVVKKLIMNKSSTTVIDAARKIISLADSDNDVLEVIIGNKQLDAQLRAIANVVTVNGIPKENKNVVKNISKAFKQQGRS